MAGQELVGSIVDERYQVESLIGQGGMGSVYRAYEIALGRIVALKVLHSSLLGDPDSVLRFEREAKVLSTFKHRNVVAVYRLGLCNRHEPYISMEYLEGESLRDFFDRHGTVSFSRALDIAIQCCQSLQCAHEAGVVHRDIKPSNIMLLKGDKPDFVKIVDFGLSKLLSDAVDQKLTGTGTLIGSPQYMSPEQCRGKLADGRSDIYSLALVIYEAVAGVSPHIADNPIGLLHKHVNERPQLLADIIKDREIPAGLDAVLQKALSKDPHSRYQTMAEFGDSLQAIRDGSGASLEVAHSFCSPKNASEASRQRLITAFVLLAVVVLGFVFFCVLSSSEKHKAGQVQEELAVMKEPPEKKIERDLTRAESLLKNAESLASNGQGRQAGETVIRCVSALSSFQRKLSEADRRRAYILVVRLQALIIKLPANSLSTAAFQSRLEASLDPQSTKETIKLYSLCVEIYTNMRRWHWAVMNLYHLAGFYETKRDLDQAEKCLERARAIEHEYLSDDPLINAYINTGLLKLSLLKKDYAAASKYAGSAVYMLARARGDNKFERIEVTRNLGEQYTLMGNYQQAEKLYLEWHALEGWHSDRFCERNCITMSKFYKTFGRLDAAAKYLDEAEAEHKKKDSQADESLYIAWMRYLHAEIQYEAGEYPAAYEKLKLTLQDILSKNTNPEIDRLKKDTLLGLAQCCFDMKNYPEAKRYYLQCLALESEDYMRGSPERQNCLLMLSQAYSCSGEFAKSEAIIARMRDKAKKYPTSIMRAKAQLLSARGKITDAEELLSKALKFDETPFLRADVYKRWEMLAELESLLIKEKRSVEAKKCLEAEISLLKKIQMPGSRLLDEKVRALNALSREKSAS